MSYCSSVGIVLLEKDYNEMIKEENFFEYMKNSKFTSYYYDDPVPSNEELYNDLMFLLEAAAKTQTIEYEGESCKYISLICVQWYSRYPQVAYIMNYLKELDFYQYLRVGEDLDDFEKRSKKCDYLGFRREILPYSDDF